MGLTERLKRIVDGMPDEAAVTLPVEWVRQQLEMESESDRAITELDDWRCSKSSFATNE